MKLPRVNKRLSYTIVLLLSEKKGELTCEGPFGKVGGAGAP